jgi:hypothetical protein
MSKIFVKVEGKVWPTVLWQNTELCVYFLRDDPEEVDIRSTRGIDFEEIILHLDLGGSVFITRKPTEASVRDHKVTKLDEFINKCEV